MTETTPSVETPAGKNATWNYHPNLPIRTSAVFAWPFDPLAAFRWLSGYWLRPSSTTLELAIAIFIYLWFLPDMSATKVLSADWIAQLFLRNAVLMTLVAGGLHLYFVTGRRQGDMLKFDPRDYGSRRKSFTFGNQVRDNMFWTLASGVTVWTAYEALWFWTAANGWVPLVTFAENPVWFLAWFVIIPIWSSFHFYVIHRLLHWPPLYRKVHSLHHRNVVIGPWSGISMHPVEHLLYFNSVAIHFVVASHPMHVLFHLLVQSLNPAFSHSGYDGIVAGGRKRFEAGDFFHQLHHRYFNCNYGTAEMPWDRWFGSFHDGTDKWRQSGRTTHTGMSKS